MPLLISTGCVLVLISLAEAWLLTLCRAYPHAMRRFIPNDRDLLRSHIDYILMALLLFAFALLRPSYPLWIAVPMCIGAFTNPLAFIMTALVPKWHQERPKAFSAFVLLSFVLTTLGFGGAALLLIAGLTGA